MFAQHLLKSTPNLKQFREEFQGPGLAHHRRGPTGTEWASLSDAQERPRSGPPSNFSGGEQSKSSDTYEFEQNISSWINPAKVKMQER